MVAAATSTRRAQVERVANCDAQGGRIVSTSRANATASPTSKQAEAELARNQRRSCAGTLHACRSLPGTILGTKLAATGRYGAPSPETREDDDRASC